jgi:hypothetical protein
VPVQVTEAPGATDPEGHDRWAEVILSSEIATPDSVVVPVLVTL